MTLGEQQRLFTKLVAQLIDWAYRQPGMQLTFGEAYRTPEQAAWNAAHGKGIAASLHISRLAIDLNVFIGGEYHTDVRAYSTLGEYWKGLHPLCRWGGDFKSGDANHFSMEWNGVK